MPNLTLEGHEKGVNAVDYYPGGDRPYLVSGADDRTARVWDYTTKACVQVSRRSFRSPSFRFSLENAPPNDDDTIILTPTKQPTKPKPNGEEAD